MMGMTPGAVWRGADVSKLFMLAGVVAVAAVGWALWIGKDDMRRYIQMRKM